MSDRLSQLQTSVDQLVTQFFSSLNYINKHHDFVPVDGEPKLEDAELESATPEKFLEDLQELSRDIVLKSQQIETLVDSLPGLNTSEKDQIDAISSLNAELSAARKEREQVLAERKRLLELCNTLILRLTKEKVSFEQVSEVNL